MDTANIIKELRIEKGTSQGDLAEFLNVDRTLVSKWESGQRSPSEEELKKICEYFGVEEEVLIPKIAQPAFVKKEEPEESISDAIREKTVLRDYAIVFGILLISSKFSPFSLPFVLFAIIFSIKKKMPIFMTIICILDFIYSLDVVLAIFGHSIFPTITIVF